MRSEKLLSPVTFSCPIFQEGIGRALARMGWGTGWPGEPQCVPARPYILAIWVRDPKWNFFFFFFCCRLICVLCMTNAQKHSILFFAEKGTLQRVRKAKAGYKRSIMGVAFCVCQSPPGVGSCRNRNARLISHQMLPCVYLGDRHCPMHHTVTG